MASLVLRHGIYHLVWREAGRQKWRSLRTGDADTARAILREHRLQQIDADASARTGPGPVGFRAFVDGPYRDYAVRKSASTISSDAFRLRRFLVLFGDRPLSSITTADIDRYRAERRTRVTASTVNREMGLLRSIFARAVERGVLTHSPCRGLRDYPVQERPAAFLVPAEVRALLAACDQPYLRAFVALAAHAGLRRGEIATLRWADVDLARGRLTVRESKTYRSRTIPLNVVLKSILAGTVGAKGDDLVLGRADGRAYRDMRASLREALRRAGITRHIRPHDLRHSFASNLVMAGVDIRTVSALLGHRSITTTMRYAHLTQDHLAGAVERIAG